MVQINQLTAVDSLQGSDNFPLYDSSNGDARRTSLTTLLAYMQSNLTLTDAGAFQKFQTQYAAPSATGFNIQITDDSNNTHLILTPVAGYAAGTITLPLSTNIVDKQEILVNCTQAVTTLTVAGNGASVVGEPSTLTANDFFRLKYDLAGTTWYRVG